VSARAPSSRAVGFAVLLVAAGVAVAGTAGAAVAVGLLAAVALARRLRSPDPAWTRERGGANGGTLAYFLVCLLGAVLVLGGLGASENNQAGMIVFGALFFSAGLTALLFDSPWGLLLGLVLPGYSLPSALWYAAKAGPRTICRSCGHARPGHSRGCASKAREGADRRVARERADRSAAIERKGLRVRREAKDAEEARWQKAKDAELRLRQEMLRRIDALENTTGRTPAEPKMYKAKAARRSCS
jgi:hypothetical protein